MKFAPRRMHRDVGNIQRQLVRDGRAVWLGQAFAAGRAPAAAPHDVEDAAVRVKALFARTRADLSGALPQPEKIG
jgi:hypothetical protein